VIIADERHGCIMSGATHHWLHDNIGARWKLGLTASDYILNTKSDAALTFEVSDGEFYDEDLEVEIENGSVANKYEQILNGADAQIPIIYRDDVDGTWTQDAATTLPYKNNLGGNLQYQNDDGDGTWSQIACTNNRYVVYWLVATNDWQTPIKMIQGSAQYISKNGALEGASTEIISWGDFPSPEVVILYQFIMQTGSYAGTKNAQIVEVLDFRASGITGASANPTSHSTLSNLGNDDHAQYILVDGTRAFSGAQSFGDSNITNVGDIALDTISADNSTSFSMSNDWTNTGNTIADLGIVTTVDINGGTIDGVTIGGASAGAGTFTSLITPSLDGGTGASQLLTIDSTSHATKGNISILPNGGVLAIGIDAATINAGFRQHISLNQEALGGLLISGISAAAADQIIFQFSEFNNGSAEFELRADFSGAGGTGNSIYFNSIWKDDILFMQGGGNIGIGTNAPDTIFDVMVESNSRIQFLDGGSANIAKIRARAGTDVNQTLYIQADNYQFLGGSGDTETNLVTIDAAGEVGIRETAPAAWLHINSPVNDNYIFLKDESDDELTHDFWIDSSGHGHTYMYAEGQSNTIQFNSNGTSFFLFNLAIGNTSATQKLEVGKDANESAIIGRAHIGYVGHDDFAGFSHMDQAITTSYALLQGSDGTTYLNAAPGKDILFRIANSTRTSMSENGNWIFENALSGATMVVDTNTNTNLFYVTRSGAASESISIGVDDAGTYFRTTQDETSAGSYGSMYFQLGSHASHTPYFRIQDMRTGSAVTRLSMNVYNGDMGISTTAPQARLHVEDAGTSGSSVIYAVADDNNVHGISINNLAYQPTDNDANGMILKVNSSTVESQIYCADNGSTPTSFAVYTDGARRMRIDETGRIGFLTDPAYDLQLSKAVSGDNLRAFWQNTSNTSNSHMIFQVLVGGTSAADPKISFTIPSGGDYALGIDNSDSDKLKYGNSLNLGTNTLFTADTANKRFGIGTQSPSHKLEVVNTTDATCIKGSTTYTSGATQAIYAEATSSSANTNRAFYANAVNAGAGAAYSFYGNAGILFNDGDIQTNGGLKAVGLASGTGSSDVRYSTFTDVIFSDTSSLKYKENIRDEADTDWLYDLKVKTYDRKDGSRKDEVGIIADELAEINSDYASFNKKGEVESYSKADLVPLLINEIQKLSKRIKALEGN